MYTSLLLKFVGILGFLVLGEIVPNDEPDRIIKADCATDYVPQEQARILKPLIIEIEIIVVVEVGKEIVVIDNASEEGEQA